MNAEALGRAVVDAAEKECQERDFVCLFGTGNAKEVLDRHIAAALTEAARLAAEAEREACARVAETDADWTAFQRAAKRNPLTGEEENIFAAFGSKCTKPGEASHGR